MNKLAQGLNKTLGGAVEFVVSNESAVHELGS